MGVSSKTSRMPVEMFSSIYFIVPLASMRIKFPFSRPHRPKVSQRNAWETCIFEFHTQNSQRASQKRAAWGISAFYCRDIYKLLSYPKKTFTRSQLMDEFWDRSSSSGLRTVDVYMTKLRDKFSACNDFEIVTVHGLGYKAVLK